MDTRPEVEQMLLEAYRGMSPSQKLRRVHELTRAARQLALARLREEHPQAGPRELALRLAALRFDPETMVRAFGWDPGEQGG
ncbi:MAG: hypothetical protein HYY06_02095 [Deltaproteobacteria bacterium]|nr:hypothetical protein [Deltaproteobacteria bacterium]